MMTRNKTLLRHQGSNTRDQRWRGVLVRFFGTIGIVGLLAVDSELSLENDVLVAKFDDRSVFRILHDSSVDSLIDRSNRVEIPDDQRELAFVHIGKSGGTTISHLLRNGCHQSVDNEPCEERRWENFPGSAGKDETIASKRIKYYLHTPAAKRGKLEWAYNHTTSIVMVGRNPLERFVSAFLVTHPKNVEVLKPPNWYAVKKVPIHDAAFEDCFPNIEEFARCLNQRRGQNVYNVTATELHHKSITMDCAELSRDIILQKEPFVIPHARWGYRSFLKPLPSNKEVFFIRTKYLWEDWVVVNNMLGSPHNVTVPNSDETKKLNARGELPIESNLSDEGRTTICHFLKGDIQIYISFLNNAVNLSDEDVRVALQELQESCPEIVQSSL